MKTKFVIANWKENPEDLKTAQKLVSISEKFHIAEISQNTNKNHVAITHAVPNIFVGYLIESAKKQKKKINIILQNISCYEGGSHTGEISATQAKNLGIEMSIVGHSETRLSPNNPKGDEDYQVNLKMKNLFKEGMWACLCIGEFERTDEEEENGEKMYLKFIENQLAHCLKDIDIESLKKLCIAYEPVWAIGKEAKRAATNEEIIETIGYIKKILEEKYLKEVKVLYGGSVDENNAKEILNLENVDGLLVGRASSDPVKWEKLLTNLLNDSQ